MAVGGIRFINFADSDIPYWHTNQGRSFLAAIRRAKAACSRWLYLVSALAKDLLMKNTGLYLPSSPSLNRTTFIATSETDKYMKSVSPASGLVRTGGSAI